MKYVVAVPVLELVLVIESPQLASRSLATPAYIVAESSEVARSPGHSLEYFEAFDLVTESSTPVEVLLVPAHVTGQEWLPQLASAAFVNLPGDLLKYFEPIPQYVVLVSLPRIVLGHFPQIGFLLVAVPGYVPGLGLGFALAASVPVAAACSASVDPSYSKMAFEMLKGLLGDPSAQAELHLLWYRYSLKLIERFQWMRKGVPGQPDAADFSRSVSEI